MTRLCVRVRVTGISYVLRREFGYCQPREIQGGEEGEHRASIYMLEFGILQTFCWQESQGSYASNKQGT